MMWLMRSAVFAGTNTSASRENKTARQRQSDLTCLAQTLPDSIAYTTGLQPPRKHQTQARAADLLSFYVLRVYW